ncbi:DUF29 domain-containing protein [Synechocystis sp. LKSZ1]|uniref:DUF29 domain-containing protein n=1 Tax=Synechocystis sp. LKSZ1 TaxID=3144951 RepID=UPI00336BBB1E
MPPVISVSLKTLYEQDFVAWLDQTAEQIRQGSITELDWEHLLEEIEALGSEQRRKVESYCLRLLIHLLCYQYWLSEKAWSGRGWEKEIDNFRLELDSLLASNVLFNHLQEKQAAIYAKARGQFLRKSGLPALTIPEQCPFSLEQILDIGFLP